MIGDAIVELSALIGGAIAASTLDRAAMLHTARQIANGGDYARARLGHLVANAIIVALESTTKPARAAAQAAFTAPKQDAQA
jgi:hypothetical protein